MHLSPMQNVLSTLGLCLLLAFAADVRAGIFFVENTNVSGPGSLQQAIAAANAAGPEPHEIRFSPDFPVGGTIQYSSENLVLSALSVTVDGLDRQPVLSRTNTPLTPMLATTSSVLLLQLRNLTFADIKAGNATACVSGFSSAGAVLRLENVGFRNCESRNVVSGDRLGGAVAWRVGAAGRLEISGSEFVGNSVLNTVTGMPSVRAGGGAVYSTADVQVENSYFSSNSALGNLPSGGAIEVQGAKLSIVDSIFVGNQAGRPDASTSFGSGGALMVRQGDLEIRGALMVENSAWGPTTSNGGAVSVQSSAALVDIGESRFDRNDALDGGGAVFLSCGNCEISLYRSTFDFNRGDFGAAVQIRNDSAQVTTAWLANNVFLRQRAADDDHSLFGSLSLRNVSADLLHNSFLENPDLPLSAGDISAIDFFSSTPTSIAVFNNLLGRRASGTACYMFGPISVAAGGNRAADPSCDVIQPDVGDSSSLPAPEFVTEGILMAPAFPGTPLVDGGALFTASCPLGEDIFGRPRPNDGDGDGEAMCDVGAYEHVFLGIFRNGFEGG